MQKQDASLVGRLIAVLPPQGNWQARVTAVLEAGAIACIDGEVAAADLRGRKPSALERVWIRVGTDAGAKVSDQGEVGPVLLVRCDGVANLELLRRLRAQHPSRVIGIELNQAGDAGAAERSGADFLVGRGMEAGGWISEESTSVLVRHLRRESWLPVVAWGGAGVDSTAALLCLGAAAVVLADGLALAEDAPSGPELRRVLESFDPRDTVQLGRLFGRRFRVYGQLGTRPVRQLLGRERELLEARGSGETFWTELKDLTADSPIEADPRKNLVALGQEAVFALPLAKQFGTTAGILQGIARQTEAILEGLVQGFPLQANAGIAPVNGTVLPIHQGPMAQTSDTPAFARAVADAGALPWLALGNMPPQVAEEVIRKTADVLQGRPFGAGIIGLDANHFRDAHIEILGRLKPPYALVAAGTAEQALTIEKLGITTYLHTPTREILRGALQSGCRKFILEGSEAGGHVGELGGLVLWQSAALELMEALDRGLAEPEDLAVVPAGGICDEESSAAAAAIFWRLHQRGVPIGIQMGTAYLLTQDIVDSGALSKGFQKCALEVCRTILMGESVKTPTRVLDTAQAQHVLEAEAQRELQGVKLADRKHKYEQDNLGGLRAAAKGQRIAKVDKEKGAIFENLTEETQRATGLFHAGQGVALRQSARTIAQLHQNVTALAGQKVRQGMLADVLPAVRTLQVQPVTSGAASASESAQVAGGAPAVTSAAPVAEPIAIIGLGAIVPGALDAHAFWENLLQGRSSIAEVPADRWDPELFWAEDRSAPDKTYSKIGGFVRDFRFDRKAFRLPPSVVESLDLTQRMALEASRQALEDAGYAEGSKLDRQRCAVILGNAMGGDIRDATNLRLNFPHIARSLREVLQQSGAAKLEIDGVVAELERKVKSNLPQVTEDSMPGELGNVIAGRVAAAFDLGGPNFVTDAACASSLAALEAAVRGLRDRRFDVALSGGVEANMGAPAYIKFSKLGALSGTQSAPFDASASGFVMGEGACIVVLKRLSDAQKDNDRIYAVIRGIGASSDGKGKGITAPNPVGQKLAVQRALQDAAVEPSSIGLIEAHGTGTPVGDRTEIGVLHEVYGQQRDAGEVVSLGSVKSNIGHLKAAAGGAGVLKATLALHHGVVPPSLNFKNPNPALQGTSFSVPTRTDNWPSQRLPRRAAVSSFGFGGTNFHLILEEAPGRTVAQPAANSAAVQDLVETSSVPQSSVPVAALLPTQPLAAMKPLIDSAAVYGTLVEVLCERTGYEAAEIEPDFELEADLGVDTVKQAEIMATVRERYGLARDEKFRLADHPSLQAMTRYVLDRMALAKPSEPVLSAAAVPQSPVPVVQPSMVQGPSLALDQPVPVAQPIAPAPAIDSAAVYGTLVEVLCERTGYEAAEIEPDFELEADLGVDTVKQAEIMATVRERYGLARDEKFRLADYPSLQAMTRYVLDRMALAKPVAPVAVSSPVLASNAAPSVAGASASFASAPTATSQFASSASIPAAAGVSGQTAAHPMRIQESVPPASSASDPQRSEERKRTPHEKFLPLLLTAEDTASLAVQLRSVLAELPANAEAVLERLRAASTRPASGRFRVAIAAADAEAAGKLLELAANALETGKGVRLLENKGVCLREAPEAGRLAFLFPGQGSQYVGMLADLKEIFPVVASTLAEADAALAGKLERPLSSYMMPDSSEGLVAQEGRNAEEALKQTAITQPAMLAADIALYRLLQQFGLQPDVVAGHSLGEYGACVASGMMDFGDGLRTVSTRGTEMARATPAGGDCGLMAAVPAAADKVEALLRQCTEYVIAANKNSPSQTVIAGSTAGVRQAMQLLAAEGLEAQLIPVSHAFHSRIVSAASEPLRRHLASIGVTTPRIPTLTNVTGDYFPGDARAIVDLLAVQLASPVEFVKVIERMHADGARTFVEVGPKRAQASFVTGILSGKPHRSYASNHPKLGGPQSLREVLAALCADGLVLQAGVPQPGPGQRQGTEVSQPAQAAAPMSTQPVDGSGGASSRVSASAQPSVSGGPSGNERPLVVSGLAIALPGMAKVFGEEDPFAAILSGRNLIEAIPMPTRQDILDKSIQRLVKRSDGSGEFQTVTSIGEVPKLAGRTGDFDLTEDFGVPAETLEAMDRASQLALGVGLDAMRDAMLPLIPDYQVTRSGKRLRTGWRLPASLGDRTGIVYASVFAGMDLFAEELTRQLQGKDLPFNRKFMLRILGLAHTQLAEFIGARGPSTRTAAACASTTQAIAIAEDWIRLGRADRVIVLGADDVTADGLLEWIGAGMFATGALTTEGDVQQAALPFDRRRHGTILGAGAVALVLEKDEDVAARGLEPIADLLATRFANSAYHATRLDVDHVASQVDAVLADAERRWSLKRHEMAARTVFMSHETFTPAQGGSAAAEIASLRRAFGDAADQVVIANTKGFTGHAMGAGLEDVVVLKALQRQTLPPIANFREPDPDLGNLRLSSGGPQKLDYALRLGAGFGSQLALALFRARAKQEDRLRQPELYRQWVGSLIGQPAAAVQVEKRVLKVVLQGVGSAPVPSAKRLASPLRSSQSPQPAGPTRDEVYNTLASVLCERTGYAADEIQPDFELEADLGVDTVKQAEIMATVRERYGLARDEKFRLADHPSLKAMTDYVLLRLQSAQPAASTQAAAPALQTGQPATSTQPAASAAQPSTLTQPAAPALQPGQSFLLTQPATPALQPDQPAAIPAPSILPVQPVTAAPVQASETTHPAVTASLVPSSASLATSIPASVRPAAGQTVSSHLELLPASGIQCRQVQGQAAVFAPQPGALRQHLQGRRIAVLGGPDALAGALVAGIQAQGGLVARQLDAATEGVLCLTGCQPATHLDEVEAGSLRLFQTAREVRRLLGESATSQNFFVTVSQRGSLLSGAAAGIAKSLGREVPGLRVLALEIVAQTSPETILNQLLSRDLEVALDGDQRLVLLETPVQPTADGIRLSPEDVVVLTGGARGITAKVALDLAARWHCKLVLLGRTRMTEADPLSIDLKQAREAARATLTARGERVTPVALERELQPLVRQQEIAATLRQLQAAGSQAIYIDCDLAEPAAVARAIQQVQARWGRIAGVIHGAGVEISRRIEEKTDQEFFTVFRGKALGALALWEAVRRDQPKFFVGFSSIAGRYGNAGQADYSAANEVLNRLLAGLDAEGKTRGLVLDWTAWDEVGMAARGSMRQILGNKGVEMLKPEVGAPLVARLLESGVRGEVVIAGALGEMAPAVEDKAPAPAGVLLDEILLFQPGHSLEARRTLDLTRDAFLRDHVYEGVALMPGVMAIEMFAEAAVRLFPGMSFAGADDVQFLQALRLHRGEPVQVFVRATAFENGAPRGQRRVEAVVLTRRTTSLGRTIETLHFRGVVRLTQVPLELPAPLHIDPRQSLSIGPDRTVIYQHMFHTGAFQLLEQVPYLGASEIVAYGERPEGQLTAGVEGTELLTDPLVREMAFQTAGLWGMMEKGNSYLPLSIGKLRHFQGLGLQRGPAVIRVRVRSVDAEGLAVDAEVRDAEGRLLQSLEDYRMVSHRPLDGRPQPRGRWQLNRLGLDALDIPGKLARLGRQGTEILTQSELGQGTRFRRHQHRDEWLAARLAAKLLCRDYLRDFYGESLPLEQIEIAHRTSGEPFARLVCGTCPLPSVELELPPLSMSHSDGRAIVVLASPAYRLRPGVDLERVEPRSDAFVHDYFRDRELELRLPGPHKKDELITALWTIKEAVAKSLGMGLRASTFELLVEAIDSQGQARVRLTGRAAEAFDDLGGEELHVRVALELGFATAEAYLLCRERKQDTPARNPAGLAAIAALLHHKGLR